MKRVLPLLFCLLAGCSSHPCANFLDWACPGRVRLDPKAPPYGGVCIPQGAPIGLGVPIPVTVTPPGPVIFPTGPNPGAVPPPVPPPPAPFPPGR
jgi:hypothetical protein